MRFIILITVILFSGSISYAQADADQQEGNQVKYNHQFFLNKKVISLDRIRIKEGPAIDGKLSVDGEMVIMHNYVERKRVILTVTNLDGSTEEIEKSPCDIFKELEL